MIFGVGLNKTGTTSFGNACKQLGMTRLGWNTSQTYRSHDLLKLWDRGETAKLVDVAGRFDALEGFPWSIMYAEMAEAFPGARFVLTRRTTPEKWLGSVTKWEEGNRGYGMHEKIFGSMFPDKDPDLWVAKYNAHLTEVRRYFAGSDRFLEVCWEEGDGWPELCGFLGVPVPDLPFPHSNPAGSNATAKALKQKRQQRPWAVRKARKLKRRLGARLAGVKG